MSEVSLSGFKLYSKKLGSELDELDRSDRLAALMVIAKDLKKAMHTLDDEEAADLRLYVRNLFAVDASRIKLSAEERAALAEEFVPSVLVE